MFSDVLLQKDVLKGKITQEEKEQTRERISVTSDIGDFGDVDFVIEVCEIKNHYCSHVTIFDGLFLGGQRKPRPKTRPIRQPRQNHPQKRHPRFQHFLHLHHKDCSVDQAASPSYRNALYEPSTCHETSGNHPGPRYVPRNSNYHPSISPRHGKNHDTIGGYAGVYRK